MSNKLKISNATPFWGNGHYYAFTPTLTKWHDAKDYSEQSEINNLHGYLATITSAEENFFIWAYSNNGKVIVDDSFLGGSDQEDTKEGQWLWKT